MRRLIVNGDDFGLAVPVNEAICEAHCRGILTTASLMVGGDAAADAVERSRRCPSLRVGLHLVLVEGRALLAPQAIPALVDSQGRFSDSPAKAGFRYALRPGIRRQLAAEIRAQFEAFADTGLTLDHVDSHNHLHLHPRIFNLILDIGRDYGLAAVRVPCEPVLASWRASGKSLLPRATSRLLLYPLTAFMKRRLRRSGIRCNDHTFGMADSGAMTGDLVVRILQHLPDGVTEMYFHPATRRCPEIDRTMPAYRHEEEFSALTSPSMAQAFAASQIERIAFGDI